MTLLETLYLIGKETEASKIGLLCLLAKLVRSRAKVSGPNMLKHLTYKGWDQDTYIAHHREKIDRNIVCLVFFYIAGVTYIQIYLSIFKGNHQENEIPESSNFPDEKRRKGQWEL